MSEKLDTRTRLLDAAEQLLAREGVERAQIQAITQLAGQRNTSALHYHFASREGLLNAVLARHLDSIENLRSQRIGELEQLGQSDDLRILVEALVLPLASKLADSTGHNYLLILQQCIGELGVLVEGEQMPESLRKLYRLLRAALRHLPKAIAEERIRFVVNAMVAALAARAKTIETETAAPLSNKLFVRNLVSMLHGALAEPHR
jgi:AcrR family transcriptional regulator